MFIYGTRPEVIKLAPIILKAIEDPDFNVITVNTGQHQEMSLQFEKIFNIKSTYNLGLMKPNQDLSELISNAIVEINKVLKKEKPDLVFVQGDTTTVLAGGIASFYNKINIAHVEAGLRSNDMDHPYPEEFNRKLVSTFAKYNFVPTENSAKNLIIENVDKKSISITGNTVVDALHMIKKQIDNKELTPKINLISDKNILITAHRRENHGEGLRNICNAIKELSLKYTDYFFYWPIHPNPNVKEVIEKELNNIKNIILLPPLDYIDLLYLISKSHLILTDSGGIQEEAPSFKKPVVILRECTERPEVIDSNYGKLVGTDTKLIIKEVSNLMDNPDYYHKRTSGHQPFGDGKAADIILNTIK